MNIWIIFLTGITTGGLSCMAVQGGLLATALTGDKHQPASKLPPATVIGLFLIAKLVAYTALGFLLGWLGTVVQLSGTVRGIIQILVAIFLIGTALRMLNVHPIFRHFVVQPPKILTRWLRRFSKEGASEQATPIFLGLLTVLIPCGVTQAMMALALSTSSPWQGATLMAAFTLGTMPIFFGLSYLATKLGHRLQHRFTLVAAILILALGVYSVEGGLNVLGSPVSFAAMRQSWAANADRDAVVVTSTPVASGDTSQTPAVVEFTIQVTDEDGYTPDNVKAPAGTPLRVTFESNGLYGCASAIVFPSLKKSIYLKETDRQTIDIPAQQAGSKLRYACAMGMYTGQISFN